MLSGDKQIVVAGPETPLPAIVFLLFFGMREDYVPAGKTMSQRGPRYQRLYFLFFWMREDYVPAGDRATNDSFF